MTYMVTYVTRQHKSDQRGSTAALVKLVCSCAGLLDRPGVDRYRRSAFGIHAEVIDA